MNETRVNYERKRQKLTQLDLSRLLKTSQSAVSQVLTRGIFDIRVAHRYAKALKCEPFILLENIAYTEY